MLRTLYRNYIHWPALDAGIYAILDFLTHLRARVAHFSFPKNYIRRWKLNMLWGLYEPETYELFKKIIKPGMIVVDIGAHIGYFTRLFSTLVGPTGRVYAFEADPENFALLIKNTRGFRNIEKINLACTEKTGMIDFWRGEKTGTHSTIQASFHSQKIAVPCISLDEWMKRESVLRIDLIKMDIEGGERAAFLGMAKTLKDTRVLVTEFAPALIEAAGGTPDEFLNTLESYGFQVSPITPLGSQTFTNLYCVKK